MSAERAAALRALAERCEREGVSEKLSVEVAGALVGAHARFNTGTGDWRLYEHPEGVSDRQWEPREWKGFEEDIYQRCRDLLTSLDAAAALERSDWHISIQRYADARVEAKVRCRGKTIGLGVATGPHAEPRARVAAALRALAAEAEAVTPADPQR